MFLHLLKMATLFNFTLEWVWRRCFLRNYFLIDKNSFFPHLDHHFWFLDTRIDNERPWILEKDRGRYLQLRMDQEVDAQSLHFDMACFLWAFFYADDWIILQGYLRSLVQKCQ